MSVCSLAKDVSKLHWIPTKIIKEHPLILSVQAALGGFVSGQDLRKGSKILAADGSIMEVADLPEVLEKRGKVVLHTDKAKFLGLWAFFAETQSVNSEFCKSFFSP